MPVRELPPELLPPQTDCFSVYEHTPTRSTQEETTRLGIQTLRLLDAYNYPDQLILQWGTDEAQRDIVDVDAMAAVSPEENIQFLDPTVDMHIARDGDEYVAGLSTWRIGNRPYFNTLVNSVAYRVQPKLGAISVHYAIRGMRYAPDSPKIVEPSLILPSPIITANAIGLQKFGQRTIGVTEGNAWRWHVR